MSPWSPQWVSSLASNLQKRPFFGQNPPQPKTFLPLKTLVIFFSSHLLSTSAVHPSGHLCNIMSRSALLHTMAVHVHHSGCPSSLYVLPTCPSCPPLDICVRPDTFHQSPYYLTRTYAIQRTLPDMWLSIYHVVLTRTICPPGHFVRPDTFHQSPHYLTRTYTIQWALPDMRLSIYHVVGVRGL
jgi:hypothetical protein